MSRLQTRSTLRAGDVPTARLSSFAPVLKSGFLKKRSAHGIPGLSVWRPKFFELTKVSLCYYLTQHKIGLLGTISMTRVKETHWLSKKKKGLVFCVQTLDRVFEFMAETVQEAQDWTEAVAEAMKQSLAETSYDAVPMRGHSYSLVSTLSASSSPLFSPELKSPESCAAKISVDKKSIKTIFQAAIVEEIERVMPETMEVSAKIGLVHLVAAAPVNSEVMTFILSFMQKPAGISLGDSFGDLSSRDSLNLESSSTSSENLGSSSTNEESSIEIARKQFLLLESKTDLKALLVHCFQDPDPLAHALAIAIFWEMIQKKMRIEKHPRDERSSCPKCSAILSEFYLFIMEYCSGDKFTSFTLDVLLALMTHGHWDPDRTILCLDSSQSVKNPELWKTYLGALHSAAKPVQRQALREALALVASSTETALAVTNCSGWEEIFFHILEDCSSELKVEERKSSLAPVACTTSLSLSPSRTAEKTRERVLELALENWQLTMSIIASLHFAMFTTSADFYKSTLKTISRFLEVGHFSPNSHQACRRFLKALISKVQSSRKFFGGDFQSTSWVNLLHLCDISTRFVMKLPFVYEPESHVFTGVKEGISGRDATLRAQLTSLDTNVDLYGFTFQSISDTELSPIDIDIVEALSTLLKALKLEEIKASATESYSGESDITTLNKLLSYNSFVQDTIPFIAMAASAMKTCDPDEVEAVCKKWFQTRSSGDKNREKLLGQISALSMSSNSGSSFKIAKRAKASSIFAEDKVTNLFRRKGSMVLKAVDFKAIEEKL